MNFRLGLIVAALVMALVGYLLFGQPSTDSPTQDNSGLYLR